MPTTLGKGLAPRKAGKPYEMTSDRCRFRQRPHTISAMALDVAVQRLLIGDVILIDIPGRAEQIEATVSRDIERTESSVRVTLRIQGSDDLVREWALDEMVTIVRGP